MKSGQRRFLKIASLAIASLAPQLSQADDITWIGTTPGSIATTVNWSSGTVPGENDGAIFAGAGGSISLNASTWTVGRIEIKDNSNGWTFHNGTIQTAQFDNRGGDGFGSTNRISSDVSIKGGSIFGSAEQYFVCASDYQLKIDGTIIDNETPLEAHLRARLSNNNTYTGRTQAWSYFEGLDLVGANGRISNSPQIDVFSAEMTLDNKTDFNGNETVDDFNNNRLNDNADVALREGVFNLIGRPDGALTETIGSMTVLRGKNIIHIGPESSQPLELHLGSTTGALKRPARGTAQFDVNGTPELGLTAKMTLESNPAGTTAAGAVPYLVGFGDLETTWAFLPVVYDYGVDEAIGGGDDVGLRPLHLSELTPITSATTMAHGLVMGASTTVSLPTVANTLSMIGTSGAADSTLTINSTLDITGGDVVMADRTYINGSAVMTIGTTEGIVHVPVGRAVIDAPIIVNNLTKGGEGTLRLSNPNNVITGETVVNGNTLELGSRTAAGTAPIALYDANLVLDFPSGTFSNTTTWESGAGNPLSGFSWLNNLQLRDGATVTYTGRIEGDGALILRGAGSKMIMTNNGVNTNSHTPFFLIENNATLELNGTFGTPGGWGYLWLNDGARVTGVGTALANIFAQNGAIVAPGSTASPIGKLTTERLELQAGSTLEIQNNSTGVRGVAYDAVDVLDNGAFLSGTIKMLSSGTVHPVGTMFDVLHMNSGYVGVPTITTDTPLTGGRQYVPIFYEDKLVIGVAGYTGDANLDGKVNTVDFNILAGHFGLTEGQNWTTGDFNIDFAVNSLDFNAFAANYGKKVTGLGPTLGSTVPEPSLGLVALATMSFCMRRKQRLE